MSNATKFFYNSVRKSVFYASQNFSRAYQEITQFFDPAKLYRFFKQLIKCVQQATELNEYQLDMPEQC